MGGKLEFCDVNIPTRKYSFELPKNIQKNKNSKRSPPAGSLCAVEKSTILYVDPSEELNEFVFVSCNTVPANITAERTGVGFRGMNITDICYTRINHKSLIICSHANGVFVGSIKLKQPSGKPFEGRRIFSLKKTSVGPLENPYIATNEHGHIFVSDPKNAMVFMFSMDGEELGTVVDLNDIGKPGPVCWCESLLSLVVSYEANSEWTILVVSLDNIIKP